MKATENTTNVRVYRDDDLEKGWAYEITSQSGEFLEAGHTYDDDRDDSIAFAESCARRIEYHAEKKALVDSALASIRENGPFLADDDETAPVVSLVYVGEKNDEKILEVYAEENYEDGQEESVAVHTLADGDDRYFDLAEFSNDEIRAILRATGINVKL